MSNEAVTARATKSEREHLESLWTRLVATYPASTPAAKIATRFVGMVDNTDGDTELARQITQERVFGVGSIARHPDDEAL